MQPELQPRSPYSSAGELACPAARAAQHLSAARAYDGADRHRRDDRDGYGRHHHAAPDHHQPRLLGAVIGLQFAIAANRDSGLGIALLLL